MELGRHPGERCISTEKDQTIYKKKPHSFPFIYFTVTGAGGPVDPAQACAKTAVAASPLLSAYESVDRNQVVSFGRKCFCLLSHPGNPMYLF